MAGVKGKSGGARAGTGGARPGAGRKASPPPVLHLSVIYEDPEKFLRAVMNDSEADARLRIDAAKTLMPFIHQKKGEGGKKEQKQATAESIASKFKSAAPPKLVATGGKKV